LKSFEVEEVNEELIMTRRSTFIPAVLAGLFSAVSLAAQAPGASQSPPPAQGSPAPRPGGLFVTFPQQTRKLAPPDVIARGKAVFGVNCVACHGADLRGGDQGGPNLLRSLAALSDEHGELISPIIHGSRQDKGMPAFNLSDADTIAVAEYIHSVLAQVGPKARPPGTPDPSALNVLVGNASAGEAYFKAKCSSCHSVSSDLKDLAAKYEDVRTLQNTWVAGGAGLRNASPGVSATGKPSSVSVTFANGQKLEGTLIQKDDFIVTLLLPDGARRSISLEGARGVPKVEVHDPLEAHRQIAVALNDKEMHDVTAYLATIK
jgi:cytochrome c oxidase cbb3-type subunit 3